MPLFSISKGELKQIKSKPFNLEKDIQTLTEENLSTVFGLQFVKSEFQIKQFRFDTIAFDTDTKSFVIIEYKKNEKFSVIDQGYAYLSIMLNNKSDFIIEYNENLDENLKRADVDWSQSKIIFVSPAFTSYQKEAINFQGLPIELYEIKRYSNQTINYNKIRASGSTESINTISKRDKKIEKVSKEIKVFTEDEFLKTKELNPNIADFYFELKNEIFNIDESIDQKLTKTMSCFYSGGKGMVWLDPWKHQLRMYFRKGKYPNKYNKLKPDSWGGYPEVKVKENEIDDIGLKKYIKELIKIAYDY